ncbi:hypothetical protein A176_002205 [Myxococcus hansupus]|uniref:Uncharacterized protein n=1 Tax=Pseudomyxococcus hansupus TaxID=1297742 RepID=A0A0H4WUM0_9BACT|nr:hypothetical protein A176_002205 [Myxococcus hansupus]
MKRQLPGKGRHFLLDHIWKQPPHARHPSSPSPRGSWRDELATKSTVPQTSDQNSPTLSTTLPLLHGRSGKRTPGGPPLHARSAAHAQVQLHTR